MSQEPESSNSWRNLAFLALGVAIVVVAALLLSQLDSLQRRSELPSNGVPINDVEATLAAGELATVYLPREATPLATPLVTPTRIQEPPPTATAQTPTMEASTECGQVAAGQSTYIVGAGDTWSSLAAHFGLPEGLLREANCAAPEQLLEGQQIFIPQLVGMHSVEHYCEIPAGWKPYKLEPGITLVQLSRGHGISIKQILKGNCLRDLNVTDVEQIYLP